MKKDDSWKGEHLIRKSVTQEEKRKNRYEVTSNIYHEKRRRAGVKLAARAYHSSLVASALRSMRDN